MLDVLVERTVFDKCLHSRCTLVALLHVLFDVRKFSLGQLAIYKGDEPRA